MRIAPLLTFCIILVRPVIGGTTPVYEANHGQFPPEVRYVSRGAPVGVAVTGDGLIFKARGDEFRVRFEHGRPLRCGMGSPVAGTSNYLATVPAIVNVPQYASLSCPEIYQGVDWLLHGNGALLEQDWTIAPNGDVSAIDIRVENALSVNLTPVAEIRMESGTFSMTWKKPVAYQEAGGKREYVPVSYAVSGTHIRLKAGAYDRSRPLIIDPVLDFVNVVAGNGDDQGCALPEPASGPSSAAYQVFVRKLSPDGSKLIYSTYLGRGNFTQRAIGMRVDAGGNVYLAANLCTSALPVAGTPIDSRGSVAVYKLAPAGDRLIYATRVLPNMGYQDPVALTIGAAGEAYVAAGIFNIAVSKIDPSGQKQLFLYSARLGVSSGGIGGAAAGADGSVYLVGTFFGSGLATTPGSWKSAPGDSADYSAFLIRLKPDGSAPVFTTYIPGEFKSSFDVAVDGAGNAYVAGAASGEAQFSGLTPTSLGTSTALKSSGIIVK